VRISSRVHIPWFLRGALICCAVFAEPAPDALPDPVRQPVPSTLEHARILNEAAELHDRGEYAVAIGKYNAVLSANPDDIRAIWELSLSYFASKDYDRCIATARRGAEYKSRLLTKFYGMMGSCLDDDGKPGEALALYRAAAKQFPADSTLEFNLGITLAKLQQWDEARAAMRTTVTLDPNYASAHFRLGTFYARTGARLPAALALCRFLVLEPDSERSISALVALQGIFDSYVKRGDKAKQISVIVKLDTPKEDGDFGALDMALGVVLANNTLDSEKAKSKDDLLTSTFERLLAIATETPEGPAEFWQKYYLRYFRELKAKGYVEPFVHVITIKGDLPGASDWLRRNWGSVQDFQAWSKAYRFDNP